MTAVQREVDELELTYVREIFLHLLDDIRYAKDMFNPAYVELMTSIKLKTTYQLKKVAEFASEHFCQRISLDKLASKSEADIQTAKAAALEYALGRLERGE
jgi:hypothetical protein